MKIKRNSGYVDVEFIIFFVCIFLLFAIGLTLTAHSHSEERSNQCKLEYLKTDRSVEDILKICS